MKASVAFLQGTVLIGPGLHFWYGFIGRTVTATGTTGDIELCMLQNCHIAVLLPVKSSILHEAGHPSQNLLAAAGTLIRLAMDQLLWAPLFISTFLASLLTLEVGCCCWQLWSAGRTNQLHAETAAISMQCMSV